MRDQLLKELKNQDWPGIIKELISYASMRLKLWGLLKNKRLKGYEPKDIAFKAIEAVFNGEWKWDSDKGELLPYLKYHVVKGLVANLAKNSEVISSIGSTQSNQPEKADDFSHEDELNATMVIQEINESIKDDPVLMILVEGLSNGLKRSDICNIHKMDTDIYDNAVRRLRTKLIQLEKKDLFTITYGRGKNK